MTRRSFLCTPALAAMAAPAGKMAVASTCYLTVRRPKDTLEFLEHCHSLGAAGIQMGVASTEPEYLKRLRERAEQYGMWLELMGGLKQADAALAAAKEVGAGCVRMGCLGGRRYETFNSMADWKKFVADSRASLTTAVRTAEKHKIHIALENHKDWTIDEMIALLKEYSSEYLGACIDTGNNISLLDDPMEVIERLAPYAVATHLKDMAVDEYPDGFLLSEVNFGEGMLDMKRVVAIILKARPKTKLTLEMITRDPLQVPCLKDKYWATFESRDARYLAKTLAMVREKKKTLPRISHLSKDEQMRVENENVVQCLKWAGQNL